MIEQNDFERVNESIKKFLQVYKVLTSDAKAVFEVQLASAIKKVDEKTKKLYMALLKAAKDGMDAEDALEEMKKTRKDEQK